MTRLNLIETIKTLNNEDLEWLKTQIDDLQTLKNTAELNKGVGEISNTNDMVELVIKIPEDVYKKTVFYREFRDLNDSITTVKALEKAVLLPKEHGRLKDVDWIEDNYRCYYTEEDGGWCYKWCDIDEAPTIIEDRYNYESENMKTISSAENKKETKEDIEL